MEDQMTPEIFTEMVIEKLKGCLWDQEHERIQALLSLLTAWVNDMHYTVHTLQADFPDSPQAPKLSVEADLRQLIAGIETATRNAKGILSLLHEVAVQAAFNNDAQQKEIYAVLEEAEPVVTLTT